MNETTLLMLQHNKRMKRTCKFHPAEWPIKDRTY